MTGNRTFDSSLICLRATVCNLRALASDVRASYGVAPFIIYAPEGSYTHWDRVRRVWHNRGGGRTAAFRVDERGAGRPRRAHTRVAVRAVPRASARALADLRGRPLAPSLPARPRGGRCAAHPRRPGRRGARSRRVAAGPARASD